MIPGFKQSPLVRLFEEKQGNGMLVMSDIGCITNPRKY